MLGRTSAAASLVAALLLVADSPRAHSIRGHGGHGHGHAHGHVGFGHHAHVGFAHFGFPFHHYGYGLPGLFYPGFYAYGVYAPAYIPAVAYLDTDVSPEEADVYLDGEYVGIADNFDGFPRHLPVEPGRHTITFKAEGYRSVTRTVRVPAGAVLELDFSMPRAGDRQRPGKRRGPQEGGTGPREVEPGLREDEDAAGPAFIRLRVAPEDASVYIDGELYGSAATLSGLHGDLRLESGRHRIEVVRPGYRAVTREVTLAPGDRLGLDIRLRDVAGR